MKAMADIVIIPLGAGLSLSPYVAACQRIFTELGLDPQLHANGTNVEGDLEVILAALERCHTELHSMGAPRVATNFRLSTRTDRAQSREDKVASVRAKLAG